MVEQRIYGFKTSRSIVVTLSCAAIVITMMALAVANYLRDTYSHASILVAVLASLIVAVTVAIPYWQARRMCARKAQRFAAQEK
jgi:FtsH-binding integral membrane protein